jgi:hypothetical protein
MNNRAGSPAGGGSPDTGDSTPETLNMVDIDNALLDEWHEFWITIKALPAIMDGNTHEVKAYHDGSLVPQTFQIILGLQNEFGFGAHLGMGLSSGTRFGAYDIDFYAYKEGVFAPTLAAVDNAVFNDDGRVDGADFLAWQRNAGLSSGATLAQGDADGNHAVNAADLAIWKGQFGTAAAAAAAAIVPEPSTSLLLAVAVLPLAFGRRAAPVARGELHR